VTLHEKCLIGRSLDMQARVETISVFKSHPRNWRIDLFSCHASPLAPRLFPTCDGMCHFITERREKKKAHLSNREIAKEAHYDPRRYEGHTQYKPKWDDPGRRGEGKKINNISCFFSRCHLCAGPLGPLTQ